LADAARRSGDWLVCKPGCTQCCTGVFAIHQLDAERLREGLRELSVSQPERAKLVRERVRQAVERLKGGFPGDAVTGLLSESDEAQAAFADFANEEICPVLDHVTGLCDLYLHRPMTCRVFGPPVASEEGLSVCELCYHGASEEQIAACEMVPDPEAVEDALLAEFEQSTGRSGRTLVAFALAEP
jgi:Fe-S-cluster containining protein